MYPLQKAAVHFYKVFIMHLYAHITTDEDFFSSNKEALILSLVWHLEFCTAVFIPASRTEAGTADKHTHEHLQIA